MRDQGVQPSQPTESAGSARRKAPPPSSRGSRWQVVAIVAIIVATAGWTTVAVLLVRPAPAAQTSTADPVDAGTASDLPLDLTSEPPLVATHDAPDLEALLPSELNATALQAESWTGDAVLSDDGWGTSMLAFLTAAGKTAADLQVGQAYDPTQALDASIGVYRVNGIEATTLRDALIAAWKTDFPEMVVSQVTLDGVPVTKATFGTDSIDSYLYIVGDGVYDIETTDEALATAALAKLTGRGSTSSQAPASGQPSASPTDSPAR